MQCTLYKNRAGHADCDIYISLLMTTNFLLHFQSQICCEKSLNFKLLQVKSIHNMIFFFRIALWFEQVNSIVHLGRVLIGVECLMANLDKYKYKLLQYMYLVFLM